MDMVGNLRAELVSGKNRVATVLCCNGGGQAALLNIHPWASHTVSKKATQDVRSTNVMKLQGCSYSHPAQASQTRPAEACPHCPGYSPIPRALRPLVTEGYFML